MLPERRRAEWVCLANGKWQKKKKRHRLHGTEGYEVQISDETVTLVCTKGWTL